MYEKLFFFFREKEKPPEDNVGLFSFIYLTWFTKYLWKAYRKGIDKNDLPNTSIFNSCAYNCQRYMEKNTHFFFLKDLLNFEKDYFKY